MPKATKKAPASKTFSPQPQDSGKGSKKSNSSQAKSTVSIKDASRLLSKGLKECQESNKPAFGSQNAGPVSNPPKCSVNAYSFFNSQMHSQMCGMPKFKDLSFAARSGVIGESWKKLSTKQKQQYVDLHEESKERYKKECKQFEKRGYFINQDGIDSRKLFKPNKAAKVAAKPAKEVVPSKKPEKVEKVSDDIVKPKGLKTAFIFYSVASRPMLVKENPNLNITEIAKINGQNWNKLDEKKKKPFFDMQAEDRLRFEKETKELAELGYFTNYDGVKSTFLTKKGRVLEFETGTVMPKQVTGAYMYFNKESMDNARKAAPDAKLEVAKIAKESGQKWREMNTQQREKYDKLMQKDQKRYNDQIDDIKTKGFFMTKDGLKSTDLPLFQKKAKKATNKKD